ncbi:hypothetical protein MX630_07510 [Carnobacterium divergens]|uniref:hypothetical protein n=2 Tax=Carnobacteriaceae TaxID=186828 RepID=UPI00186B5C1F|nr:hypothetical protein [Carnobacterium divergens]MDT1955772.1 hypothetical protein [Carnobacterium divergens]MPQ23076.1 hypothetical protein [Carnobacterium divergens]
MIKRKEGLIMSYRTPPFITPFAIVSIVIGLSATNTIVNRVNPPAPRQEQKESQETPIQKDTSVTDSAPSEKNESENSSSIETKNSEEPAKNDATENSNTSDSTTDSSQKEPATNDTSTSDTPPVDSSVDSSQSNPTTNTPKDPTQQQKNTTNPTAAQ